jgi:hypothetical protein
MHSDLCYTKFFSAWRFNAGFLPLICGRYSALGDVPWKRHSDLASRCHVTGNGSVTCHKWRNNQEAKL